MKTTVAPLIALLAAGMMLTACASDGGWGWHHHDHDHDHDGDHRDDHLVGQLSGPGGAPAPVIAGR
jgi:hypothetical protein